MDINDDLLNQEESSLNVPQIEIRLDIIEAMPGDSWAELRAWCNIFKPAPKVKEYVLYQEVFDKRAIRFYFSTKELYLAFVKEFPWVLKGTEEPI